MFNNTEKGYVTVPALYYSYESYVVILKQVNYVLGFAGDAYTRISISLCVCIFITVFCHNVFRSVETMIGINSV